ncbi:MAG: sulfite exporter TauE/SafE family protein [Mariprofundaceae bacterium]
MIFPAALVIGLVLGLFGAGGGMATVPTIMALMDVGVKEAIAMSLWVVAFVSLTAAIHQRVWRFIEVRMLTSLAVSGVVGSAIGARIGMYVPEIAQLLFLGVLIFFVAWWIVGVKLETKVGIFRWIPALLVGFVIGILTGVLGVGGGFLLVPALIYLGIKDFPVAVGHSLVLITLNATSGALAYIGQLQFPIASAATISAIAAVGAVLGGILLKRLPAEKLQHAFAVLLCFLGSWMFWQVAQFSAM